MDRMELLDAGRAAFAGHAWAEAYDRLAAADPDEAKDLEQLAMAAHLAGHDDASTEAWARAHRAHLARGEPAPAVRCAFWLGFALMLRGEAAQGGGWLARARSLLDERRLDCVERGYLLLPEALMAMAGGDHAGAFDRFAEVTALARRFADADLAALGAIGRGEALLCMGRGPEGMDLFDEAMVSVTTGELSPMVSGVVYCAVIDSCQQAFDLQRAREWTAALDRWCVGQPGLVPYRGVCLVHRAQILRLQGAWPDALAEARRACERLSDPPHPAIGMAHYELGELHRLRGEPAAAEAAYRQAHACGRQPQPGLALLRLAEGRVGVATAAIEQAVADAHDEVTRTRLLPGYVEILLAAGRVDDAAAAAEHLAGLAASMATPQLRAVADGARGAVLHAQGDWRRALESLHAALAAWLQLDARYEAARVRVLMAEACAALDDHDSAGLEREAARKVLEEVGARPDLARLDGPSPDAPVTARERQVLRLVAAGRTNREIARELGISERTVERHLGNIFTKLAVPNRAAATAYAYDHGLV